MIVNNIRLAMAVDHLQNFQSKHFGDADQYLIYEWKNNEFVLFSCENNLYKDFDEEAEHGSWKKGQAIIGLLKEKGVNVLVSKQFGRNIRMVNRHFIPVIIYTETPHEVLPVLNKHMRWIEDELLNNPPEHKLFTIKNGVLKTAIKG
jgi:predicted Fe-Mo cluster-binding NifX family protein